METAISRGLCSPVLVLRARDGAKRSRTLRQAAYYFLRLFIMPPKSWRPAPEPLWLQGVPEIELAPDVEGIWESVPEDIVERIKLAKPSFILKCGLGLIKGSILEAAPLGVWSWHHGDPRHYRGRPAGFWEIFNDEKFMGAMLQRLTDKLDSGAILAEGKYRLSRWSYRSSLETAYLGGAELLAKACESAINQRPPLTLTSWGKNYRLPSNIVVLRFIIRQLREAVKRAFYGAFVSKNWFVAFKSISNFSELEQLDTSELNSWLERGRGGFFADPFLLPDGTQRIVCEVENRRTSKGEIAVIDKNGCETILLGGDRHYSYPFVFEFDGEFWILPEMAAASRPIAYQMSSDFNSIVCERSIGLDARVLDPTLLFHNGRWWLFGTKPGPLSLNDLYLWYASTPFGPWTPHPLNPIVQDPSRARPAGSFVLAGGYLYRMGQDCSRSYGGGVTVTRVQQLDEQNYVEQPAFSVPMSNYDGLHTVSYVDGMLAVDVCTNRLDPFAWLTRLKSRG